MIGIICKKNEGNIIAEFFELFKTPWEFYQKNHSYDVVICTKRNTLQIEAKLLIIYSSDKTDFDTQNKIIVIPKRKKIILKYNDKYIPIYGEATTFNTPTNEGIIIKGTTEAGGIEINRNGQKILRIGYDLFQEIYFLLTYGQPIEHSRIPTLEFHISMLRDWILNSRIPLIEIPPIPLGYDFITCLTHDVDFVGIRNHKFDKTIVGFIYRALLGSFINVLKGKTSWNRLLKNWKAVLLLPAVYLGILPDFWVQFEKYIKKEKDLFSTFFIVPYKNQGGERRGGELSKGRSVRYDINDVKSEVHRLISCGHEIGVHGINAWWDSHKGCEEFNRISLITGRSDIGIRMHWLYFTDRSPQFLEKAGYLYDSTFGYNDAVGYRAGTSQIFRPLIAKMLLEVPLIIQDTALFYPKRMNLTESRAFNLVDELLNKVKKYGGVFTINWHHRSMAPERLWGNFYIKLLINLKKHNVWFAKASEAVKWFSMRRLICFEEAEITLNSVKLRLKGHIADQKPGLLLRIHKPNCLEPLPAFSSNSKSNYIDFPLENEIELQF
ncbi:MAG: hypothetical protein ACMUIP_10435 [bacterium]